MSSLDAALRLIIVKSPASSSDAARAFRSITRPDSRAVQRALESALCDPAATLTEADRALITACLTGASAARDLDVRLRVTAEEKHQIQEVADAAGLSVSNLIRQRLGLALVSPLGGTHDRTRPGPTA